MSGRKKCPACNGTGFVEPFMDPCRHHERVVAEKDARIKELEGRVEAQRRELSEWVEQDAMWRGMVRRLEATIEEATNE